MNLSPRKFSCRKYSNEYWVEHNSKIEQMKLTKKPSGNVYMSNADKPPKVSSSKLFKPKDFSNLVPRPPSRIKYEQGLKNYDSKFNKIFDPRDKLIKSNTIKDLKELTSRKSISNLQIPLGNISARNEDEY